MKPAYIILEGKEGKIEDNFPLIFSSWDEVNKKLRSYDAPKRGEGYDKTFFKIVWDNDDVYSGRIDLTDEFISLQGHVQDFLEYVVSADKGYGYDEYKEDAQKLLNSVDFGSGNRVKELEEQVKSLEYILEEVRSTL